MEPFLLYEDDCLLVAEKSCGLLSEAHDTRPNLPALLKKKTGCAAVYAVHRLDRTTQGLIIYAKTPEAARLLSAQAQRGDIEKRYLAVAEGIPALPSGELRDLLYYDRRKNKSYVVSRQRKGVKVALLRYETRGTAKSGDMTLTLLAIRLMTGRTHQIRVQFASRGTPLAGDRRYGGRYVCDDIALCAAELCFTHPFSGERLCFHCQPKAAPFALFGDITELMLL